VIRRIKNIYHLLQALIANVLYGFPSRKITVIGVTGTDGKTTTTSIIYHILKENNKKAAMISTVGAFIGSKKYDVGFHVTTPSPFGLQKYIRKAVDEGNEFLVLEVTSHGLDQNRSWGISYDIGVVTNVTHEHLDYHKTYEKYLQAKFKLLNNSKVWILNKDDDSYLHYNYLHKKQPKKRIITYGIKNQSDLSLKNFRFKTRLIGEFNTYNSLGAIAVSRYLELNDEGIRKALLTFSPPQGRQEVVYDKGFTVMVDFAHTPNSFYRILPEVKKLCKGRLIHVFGCAGLRDTSKRPLMGKASSAYADIIILTAEDPRTEPLSEINNEIKKGINGFTYDVDFNKQEDKKNDEKKCFEIDDRKKAIQFAINFAKEGDYVITTGKSHEKSMNYGKGEEHWDEFGAVEEAIKKRKNT
jgi:UDP-N-acetylmuramoyl-L-alanyl-D-glutamate--2,6-diaminopimelate ligase